MVWEKQEGVEELLDSLCIQPVPVPTGPRALSYGASPSNGSPRGHISSRAERNCEAPSALSLCRPSCLQDSLQEIAPKPPRQGRHPEDQPEGQTEGPTGGTENAEGRDEGCPEGHPERREGQEGCPEGRDEGLSGRYEGLQGGRPQGRPGRRPQVHGEGQGGHRAQGTRREGCSEGHPGDLAPAPAPTAAKSSADGAGSCPISRHTPPTSAFLARGGQETAP